MKSFITSFVFFISFFFTHAQDRAFISDIYLYDFCYCDYQKDDLIRGYNEINEERIDDTLSNQPIIKGSMVLNEKDIVFLRIFHDSTMYIKEEYVKLEVDTFHYVRHDNSNKHRVLERGIYYFDRKSINIDSTYFYTFDPDTYDEIKEITIYHFYQKIKHGNWIEKDATKSMNGSYFHGKRNGDWYFNYYENFRTERVTYQNGQIINEEEVNLIHKENNLEELEAVLTDGKWRRSFVDDLLIFQKDTTGNYTFSSDYSYTRQIHREDHNGKWKINIKRKEFIINYINYEIDWFSSDLIQLSKKKK